jgi:hypothetical protein
MKAEPLGRVWPRSVHLTRPTQRRRPREPYGPARNCAQPVDPTVGTSSRRGASSRVLPPSVTFAIRQGFRSPGPPAFVSLRSCPTQGNRSMCEPHSCDVECHRGFSCCELKEPAISGQASLLYVQSELPYFLRLSAAVRLRGLARQKSPQSDVGSSWECAAGLCLDHGPGGTYGPPPVRCTDVWLPKVTRS